MILLSITWKANIFEPLVTADRLKDDVWHAPLAKSAFSASVLLLVWDYHPPLMKPMLLQHPHLTTLTAAIISKLTVTFSPVSFSVVFKGSFAAVTSCFWSQPKRHWLKPVNNSHFFQDELARFQTWSLSDPAALQGQWWSSLNGKDSGVVFFYKVRSHNFCRSDQSSWLSYSVKISPTMLMA